MTEVNWVHVVAAFLGGGAMGAVINALVAVYRSRIQRVGRRIEIMPVFRQAREATPLSAQIAITHAGNTRTFNNLYLVVLQVVNRGNKDMNEFDFGVTLSEGVKCLYTEA